MGSLVVLYLVMATMTNWSALIRLQVDRLNETVPQGSFEDYVAFYTAGDFILHGRGNELYDLEAIAERQHEIMDRGVGGTGRLGFFNPPFVAVMFAPLALLPIDVAAVVLFLVNMALILVAGATLQRLLGVTGILASFAYWAGLLSLFSLYWMLGHGQLSMFILLGFLGFFVHERQGRHRLAGISLALLLIKPQMALLAVIVLLYKRRWTELATFSVVAAALVVVSTAVTSPAMLIDYPKFALNAGEWERTFAWQVQRMYGLNGLLAAVLDKHSLAHFVATTAATVGVAILVTRAFRGNWDPSSRGFPLAVSALVAATVLINPHVWMQDMVLFGVIVALALVDRKGREHTFPIWMTMAILVWTSQWISFRVEQSYGLNLQTPLLLAAFFVLVWEVGSLRRSVNRPAVTNDVITSTRVAA